MAGIVSDMNEITPLTLPPRGPTEHDVREQIVVAAEEHFSRYGYQKTAVSDLAKAIGFSKAYIYKFFDSKQAIGEAICAKTVSATIKTVEEAVAGATTPTEKFRRMFKVMVATGVTLFFNDRRLYDVAAHAAAEGWPPARDYAQWIRQLLMEIVREGRETGEFERKTPLDETVHAIYLIMRPYANPRSEEHTSELQSL